MLHVVFTIQYLAPDTGGPAHSVPALACAITSLGNSAEFVTTYGIPADFKLVASNIKANKLQLLLAARRATHARLILHDNGIWRPINQAASRVAGKLKIPFIISTRGMLTPWALRQKTLKKRLAWWLYQRHNLEMATSLHATSAQEANELRALGLRGPIAVIPNGVEIPPWQERPPRDGSTRTALFLSRIHKKKGLLNLVRAWARVRPEGWRLVIAGPDEDGHRAEVESAIASANLNGVISFTGAVTGESKWALYKSTDLFVLPSFSENFGLVVGEALACGLPVITTIATPWAELSANGCGWWIDTTVDALTETLRAAVSLTDHERHEMGRRGRTLVEKRYQWHTVAQDMLSVYEWLLGNGTRPGCVRME